MLFPLLILSLLSSYLPLVVAQVVGRWGSSALLLTPSNPTLLIISGKSYIAGQTFESNPITSTSLYLDLSLPMSNSQLLSPNWVQLNGGPNNFQGAALATGQNSGLIFGGDGTGAESVQTTNDSIWTLSLSSNIVGLESKWVHEVVGSYNEPMRRQLVYSTSISTMNSGETETILFIYGGIKSDGSRTVLNELWILESNTAGVIGNGWNQVSSINGPKVGQYDGVAVFVLSSKNEPIIYLIGGIAGDSLVSLSTIYVFNLSTFSWKTISLSNAPIGRRGHIAVSIGNNQVFIQGGRNLDGSIIYSNAYILNVETLTWRESGASIGSQGIPPVYDHVAVVLGDSVLISMGYGANAPAASALIIYSITSDSYSNQYTPSYALPLQNSGIGATPTIATNGVNGINNPTLTLANPLANGMANPTPSIFPSVASATYFPPGSPRVTAVPNVDPNFPNSPNLNSAGTPFLSFSGTAPSITSSAIFGPLSTSVVPASTDSNNPPSKSKILIAVLSAFGGLTLLVIGVFLAYRRRPNRATFKRLKGDGSVGRWIGIPVSLPKSRMKETPADYSGNSQEKGRFIDTVNRNSTKREIENRNSGVRRISLSQLWARRDREAGKRNSNNSSGMRRAMLLDEDIENVGIGWTVFDELEGEAAIGLLNSSSEPRQQLRRIQPGNSSSLGDRYAGRERILESESYGGGSIEDFNHLQLTSSDSNSFQEYETDDQEEEMEGMMDLGLLSAIEEYNESDIEAGQEGEESDDESGQEIERNQNRTSTLFGSFQPQLTSTDSHSSEESGASLRTGGGASLKRSVTWWQRINALNPLFTIPTTTPLQIRDPTVLHTGSTSNTFATAQSELGGRNLENSGGRASRNHLQSLSGKSDGTASSSMVSEERMRTMDVITGSRSIESRSILSRNGSYRSQAGSEDLAFDDNGSGIMGEWSGPNSFGKNNSSDSLSVFPVPPPRTISPSNSMNRARPLLSIRNLESTPTKSSPTNRTPSSESLKTDGDLEQQSSSGHSGFRASGVQAMIQKFETSSPARIISLEKALLAPINESPESSKSKSSGLKDSPESGKSKRSSRSKGRIVKRQSLYVANPDDKDDAEEEK